MEVAMYTDPTTWQNFLKKKALELEFTRCETSVFLTRFDPDNWLSRIEDIWEQSDVNSSEVFIKHSTRIYKKVKPFCPKVGKGAGNFPIVREWLLEEFNNKQVIVRSDDDSLLTTEEVECYQEIVQPGALIRIKAPSKMGKTRLLNNILSYGDRNNYATVHINLLQIESSKFENLDLFLRWFCIYIQDKLELDLDLEQCWDQDEGSIRSCTEYLDDILQVIETPLILGLDEVDRLLNYPQISQDFFYLLRSWYEESNNNELWEKLRMVVVYSTQDFGSLDINQSPFNVGIPIELESFDLQQIKDLAVNYHQLNLNCEELNLLLDIFGGHRYLVDLTLSYLAKHPQVSLSELITQTARDNSIYSSYLRRLLINLRSNRELTEVFLDVLNSPKPIAIDTILGYQLYRMGLIKYSQVDNTVLPNCELYKQYFLPRLRDFNLQFSGDERSSNLLKYSCF